MGEQGSWDPTMAVGRAVTTWRIIPVSKWLITMVIVRPLNGVMGPLINGRTLWLVNRGDPNHLQVLGWSSKHRGTPRWTSRLEDSIRCWDRSRGCQAMKPLKLACGENLLQNHQVGTPTNGSVGSNAGSLTRISCEVNVEDLRSSQETCKHTFSCGRILWRWSKDSWVESRCPKTFQIYRAMSCCLDMALAPGAGWTFWRPGDKWFQGIRLKSEGEPDD